MKNIDIKSLIIGALLTSTIFLGVAATSKDDKGKWDFQQKWELKAISTKDLATQMPGWEPYAVLKPGKTVLHPSEILLRRRVK